MYQRIIGVVAEKMQGVISDRLAGLMKSVGIDLLQLQVMASGQMSFDPYRIMGLDKSSSDEEVKNRYHDLLRKLHPDTAGAEGTTFLLQMVLGAYEMIKQERGWQ